MGDKRIEKTTRFTEIRRTGDIFIGMLFGESFQRLGLPLAPGRVVEHPVDLLLRPFGPELHLLLLAAGGGERKHER